MTTLKVVVNNRKGFTPEQVTKHAESCAKLQWVLNTVEFRTSVLYARFNQKTTKGKTNTEIYQIIMTGSEELTPEPDGEVDVSVELYESNNSTVGWTTPNDLWTHLNRKFFNEFDEGEVAGNIFHEWIHKLGFDHRSAKDYTSVPYLLGYLVRDMIHEMDKGRIFTPLGDMSGLPPVIVIEPKKYVCSRSWRTFFRKVCSYE